MSLSDSPGTDIPSAGEGNAAPSHVVSPPASAAPPPATAGAIHRRLFDRSDWLAFGLTAFISLIVYLLTLAPEITLGDSGIIATSAYYPGASRPPGYPLWEVYAWGFCKLLPVGNIAWRIGVSSAFAAAVTSGLMALMVSCVSRPLLKGIPSLAELPTAFENTLRLLSGSAAGLLFAFSRGIWSKAVYVEMDALRVLFLASILAVLLRWMFAPDRLRYLFLAAFLYGAGVSTFQSLWLAGMGFVLGIALVRPKLGRDLFLLTFIILVLILGLPGHFWNGLLASYLWDMPSSILLFALLEVIALLACLGLAIATRGILTEALTVTGVVISWLGGALTYLLLPIFSMTNPPVNWSYPRSIGGFFHSLYRGQYERWNPVNIFTEFKRFAGQLFVYHQNLGNDAAWLGLLAALVVIVVLAARCLRVQRLLNFTPDTWLTYDEGWLIGLLASFFGLSWLLVIFINFSLDRQFINFVSSFFTPGKMLLSILAGCGLALISALVWTRFKTFKPAWLIPSIGLLLPLYSLTAHWHTCSLRNHWFGYWFGHDIFTPPFKDQAGKPIYPEMARNAILYGGTDPGRFCPTYMIFCESFTPHWCQPAQDQTFDRRDVYLLTQNALADGTYLEYIRAHYNRSKQIDPPFFQELLRTDSERTNRTTNFFARMCKPLDDYFTKLGADIEKERRAQGVFPPQEIYIATPEDSQRCFNLYMTDATRRFQHDAQSPNDPKQIKPGEDLRMEGARVQVSGQTAVMSINGLLTKVMFDQNPTNEFYVEESFSLDWMYPHLSPFGIIMKINRRPLPSLSEEVMQKDHAFWEQYANRLTGNVVRYDSTVKEICAWIERVYLRHDLSAYAGSREFIYDGDAQKSFSKLRSSIGGIYAWRLNPQTPSEFRPKNDEEMQRLVKEANFAFLQAFAFCPYSPEAVFRYVQLLAQFQRFEDALLVAQTCLKFDPDNRSIIALVANLTTYKNNAGATEQSKQQIRDLEQAVKKNPEDFKAAFTLASLLLQAKENDRAAQVLEDTLNNPKADGNVVLGVVQAFAQIGNAKLEGALEKLVKVMPDNPEGWYDLAAYKATVKKPSEAIPALRQALVLSARRLQKNPQAHDLLHEARRDSRFASLPPEPEFKELIK